MRAFSGILTRSEQHQWGFSEAEKQVAKILQLHGNFLACLKM